MSQFAFLRGEWPAVCEAAGKAEAAVRADPRTACFYARRALELGAWPGSGRPSLRPVPFRRLGRSLQRLGASQRAVRRDPSVVEGIPRHLRTELRPEALAAIDGCIGQHQAPFTDTSGTQDARRERAGYRFAIVVTERAVDPPEDVSEAGVVYRHVNIAVDPALPSRAARAGV